MKKALRQSATLLVASLLLSQNIACSEAETVCDFAFLYFKIQSDAQAKKAHADSMVDQVLHVSNLHIANCSDAADARQRLEAYKMRV